MSANRNAYHREWQARNRKRVREYNRQWRARHLDKARTYNREWMRAYRARKREERGLPPLPPVTVTASRRTDRDLDLMQAIVKRLPSVTLTAYQQGRLRAIADELMQRSR